MRHLKISLLFVLANIYAGHAFALIPTQTVGDFHYWSTVYPSIKLSSPEAVCDDSASRLDSSTYDYTCDHVDYNDSTIYFQREKLTSPGLGGISTVSQGFVTIQCVDGSAWDYQAPVGICPEYCPPGDTYNYSTQQCDTPVVCDLGFNLTQEGTGSPPSSICQASCEYVPDGPAVYFGGDSWIANYKTNGSTCTGDSSNPLPNPNINDQPDQFPDLEEPTIPDDGDSTKDPATDEGQEGISNQLGGIQSQLSEIGQGINNIDSNTNGVESLLAQMLAQGQGTGTSGTGTGDQDGDGTDDSFSDGGCGAPPACNGPPIECAIANQAYLTRCNLQDETTDITEADVMAQTGQTETLEQYFDDTKPENIIDIDNYFTPATETTSSCPGDYNITTSLGSINLGFSKLCDFGNAVRPIILLATWIVVGFMFHNSLLRNWT